MIMFTRECSLVFFFNDTATTEIYTLSLHGALPIWGSLSRPPGLHRASSGPGHVGRRHRATAADPARGTCPGGRGAATGHRSEEHTSELQSRQYLVCRLLLEKKKHIHLNLTPTHI